MIFPLMSAVQYFVVQFIKYLMIGQILWWIHLGILLTFLVVLVFKKEIHSEWFNHGCDGCYYRLLWSGRTWHLNCHPASLQREWFPSRHWVGSWEKTVISDVCSLMQKPLLFPVLEPKCFMPYSKDFLFLSTSSFKPVSSLLLEERQFSIIYYYANS